MSEAATLDVIVKQVFEIKTTKPSPVLALHFSVNRDAQALAQDTVNAQVEGHLCVTSRVGEGYTSDEVEQEFFRLSNSRPSYDGAVFEGLSPSKIMLL